jgi:hypothetical protein
MPISPHAYMFNKMKTTMTHHTNSGDVFSQLRARQAATLKRFEIGQIVVMPPALERLAKHGFNVADLIARHHSGDWGDVSPAEARRNAQALISGARLLSVYRLVKKMWLQSMPRTERSRLPTIWIETTAANDTNIRAATTILCPEDW